MKLRFCFFFKSDVAIAAAPAPAGTTTTSPSAPPARDDLIDLTRVTPSTSLFQAAASALQSVVENPAGVATAASASANKPTPTTRPDLEFNGFNLIDMEKEIKFINCIEQLKNMGYSDDGGWLTRLVISKEGNIHAVLDSLHPTKN